MALICRGLRGATTVQENSKEAILEATHELLQELLKANSFQADDVAAAFFTTTQDLNAEFPAVAARQMGWEFVPLICGHEMKVPDSLPLCIRVMILVNTEKRPDEMAHKYLRGAVNLRTVGIS